MDNSSKQGIIDHLNGLKREHKPLIGREIAGSYIAINLTGEIYAWIDIDKETFNLLEKSSNSASRIIDGSLEDLLKDFLESRFI